MINYISNYTFRGADKRCGWGAKTASRVLSASYINITKLFSNLSTFYSNSTTAVIKLTSNHVMSLKVLKRTIRSPQFNNLSILIIPYVRKIKKFSQPIKTFTIFANKLIKIILRIFRDVHLTIMRIRWCIRRHLTHSTRSTFKYVYIPQHLVA